MIVVMAWGCLSGKPIKFHKSDQDALANLTGNVNINLDKSNVEDAADSVSEELYK